MPDYNLQDQKIVGIVDVQFSPLATPMVAWYAWLDEDGGERTDQRPVLGVVLRHEVNGDGEVTGSRLEMAVQFLETEELCVADDRSLLAENERFLGIYPAGVDAPTHEISNAHARLRKELARKKSD